MTKQFRKQLFVDKNVQGTLLSRIIWYWSTCVAFLTLALVFGRFVEEPSVFIFFQIGEVLRQHWPVYILLFSLLPFMIIDCLKLSHRFVGPILRIRSAIASHNRGEEIAPISLREHDFWHDLADEVNEAWASSSNSGAVEVVDAQHEDQEAELVES